MPRAPPVTTATRFARSRRFIELDPKPVNGRGRSGKVHQRMPRGERALRMLAPSGSRAPEFAGPHAFVRQELPIEVGDATVAAILCNRGNGLIAGNEPAASFIDSQPIDEADKGLTRGSMEEAAEGSGSHADMPGNLRLRDIQMQSFPDEAEDQFDFLTAYRTDIAAHLIVDAGQRPQLGRGSQIVENFQQADQSLHASLLRYARHACPHAAGSLTQYLQSTPCSQPQLAQAHSLRNVAEHRSERVQPKLQDDQLGGIARTSHIVAPAVRHTRTHQHQIICPVGLNAVTDKPQALTLHEPGQFDLRVTMQAVIFGQRRTGEVLAAKRAVFVRLNYLNASVHAYPAPASAAPQGARRRAIE